MTNTSLHMSHKHLHICQTLADVRCFSASRKARLCNTFYNGHQAVIGAPGGRKLIVSITFDSRHVSDRALAAWSRWSAPSGFRVLHAEKKGGVRDPRTPDIGRSFMQGLGGF